MRIRKSRENKTWVSTEDQKQMAKVMVDYNSKMGSKATLGLAAAVLLPDSNHQKAPVAVVSSKPRHRKVVEVVKHKQRSLRVVVEEESSSNQLVVMVVVVSSIQWVVMVVAGSRKCRLVAAVEK